MARRDREQQAPAAPASSETEPPAAVEPGAPLSPAGHTRCVVRGSSVVSGGRLHQVDAVADFPDEDVLSLPDHLIPL